MTFLNPALLLALGAVALPLLIHLFSRRKFPQIDFSTLRFLKRLQRQQMRRLQLRQWLLLLMRTLALLLIVLAFSRPALRGNSGLKLLSTGRIGMAIIIDASASMQAQDQAGSLFQEAKKAAATLISMMNPGDRAMIVLARKQPEPLTEAPSTDPQVLLRALNRAQAWDGSADLSAAVKFAADILSSARDFRSEIYILSDFSSAPPLPAPPAGMIPYFVPIAPSSAENLAVAQIEVLSEIIEPGQPVDISVLLTNYGSREREDVYYSIFLNGLRVAEDVVTLAAGGKAERRHQIMPREAGLQQGTVQLEVQDALSLDNRAYFCFSVPERLQVLLVADRQEGRQIRLALSPGLGSNALQERGPGKLMVLQQAAPQSWDTQQIGHFDVVIFSDPPNFSEAQAARLIHFVESGGGLLILPGNHTDLSAVNRELLAKLGTPRWGERIGQPNDRKSFLSWQALDLNSPLLRGMFRPGSEPTSPHFFMALRFLGDAGHVPIRFSRWMPFLNETKVGRGRVMLCASSPDPDWSDWAERGIFAPLLHRIVLRLAGSSRERCQTLRVGDDFEVRAAHPAAEPFAKTESTYARRAGFSASLTYPDGRELKLPPRLLGQRTVYYLPQINPAGLYRLQTNNGTHLAAVNIPPEESRLSAASLKTTYPDWYDADVHLADPARLAQTVRASRYGRELWKLALISGLILLGAESLLGSSGASTSPEERAQKLAERADQRKNPVGN